MFHYLLRRFLVVGTLALVWGASNIYDWTNPDRHGWVSSITVLTTVGLAVTIRPLLKGGINRRAYQLLMESLTPLQRRSLTFRGSFYVRGSDGRMYQISERQAYNVRDANRRYCAYPRGVPLHDCLLAQKLLIETNVSHFKKTAFTKVIPSSSPFPQ